MKLKYIIMFLSMLLICKIGLSDSEEENNHTIINNPLGWNIPDISLMKKVGSKRGLKNVICDIYIFQSNEKPSGNKVILPFVLNKRNRIGNLLYNEELTNYTREWSEGIYIIREKIDNKIICYVNGYFEDANNAEEIYDYISGHKYSEEINISGEPGRARIGIMEEYIIDLDNDGILESLLTLPPDSIETNALLIKKIKEEYIKNQNDENRLPVDLEKLKSVWIKYLNYPSQENMNKILPILSSMKIEKIDSVGKNQKKLWNSKIQDKLAWTELVLDLGIINSQKDRQINEFWNWICQSTYELEKSVYTSDRTAVKICFKLIPFAVNNQSGRVGRILDRFIQINPQMFLEELKEHYEYIELEDVLDGNFGLELIGKADLKYLENEKKIAALKKVQDPKLIELKDQCIEFIEKELKYLQDNFYLRDDRK